MKLFVLVSTLVTVATAFQFQAEWEEWKKTHNRMYETVEEELRRHITWEAHKLYVDEHNKHVEKFGFTLAMNQFADMENTEFRLKYNGLLPRDPNAKPDEANYRRVDFKDEDLPTAVDWRSKGLVTPVKNQGHCGACWAFATTGSLEGQYARKTKNLTSLSEQQLVDCSTSFGNHGCKGGLPDLAFKYLTSVKGDESEKTYPYQAENGKCRYNITEAIVGDKGYKDIPSKDENALKEAVANVGPIAAGMDASGITFQLYHSGVYNPWLFGCSQTKLDHGVLVVGYGTEKFLLFWTHDYWLVKNSWGTGWGEDGYFKLKRGDNKCGIATMASYPTGL